MTPEQLAPVLLAIVADTELTPEAARLVQYVLGLGDGEDGWHPVGYAKISALLAHAKEHRIKGAIAAAESAGWLEADYRVGRGNPRFRVCPGKILGQTSVSPGNFLGQNALSSTTTTNLLPTNGREAPSVENSRPAPAGARVDPPTPEELVPIREHLAEFAYAVDVFAGSVGGGSWPAAILGKYGPTGTRREFWKGIAADREPAILADAMLNYASDFPGKPYQAPLFESLLTRARDGAPVKPPKIVPGSEHERVRSSYGAETPGDTRGLHRATVAVPERVLVNLRRNAEAKAGPDADPAVVDQLVAETAAAWEKNHGNGTRLTA